MLRAAARAADVHFVTGTKAIQLARKSGGWKVEVRAVGPDSTWYAKQIFIANGKQGALFPVLGARRLWLDQLFAMHAWLPADPAADSRTWIESVEHGWWYSAVVPQGGCITSLFTDANLIPPQRSGWESWWRSLLADTRLIRNRVCTISRVGLRLASARTANANPVAGENWTLIGDAALAFDPICGTGLHFALESALRAVRDPGGYPIWCDTVFRRYLLQRAAYYRIEKRWPSSPFWSARRFAHPGTGSEFVGATNREVC
jgi:flavin-dependent dehydrogenase